MEKTLEELATVELPSQGTYKFIVAEITDGTDTKHVLIGWPRYAWHADIADAYRHELPVGIKMCYPRGGGRITMTSTQLHAYGYSGSYGTAPQELVEKLLKPYAEEKKLELKVEMGKGY